MLKVQLTCSAPIDQDKTKNKTSPSGGLATVPMSTQHENLCKKLKLCLMFNIACIFTASNLKLQEVATKPTQISATSVVPKRLENNQGEY